MILSLNLDKIIVKLNIDLWVKRSSPIVFRLHYTPGFNPNKNTLHSYHFFIFFKNTYHLITNTSRWTSTLRNDSIIEIRNKHSISCPVLGPKTVLQISKHAKYVIYFRYRNQVPARTFWRRWSSNIALQISSATIPWILPGQPWCLTCIVEDNDLQFLAQNSYQTVLLLPTTMQHLQKMHRIFIPSYDKGVFGCPS